MQCSSRLPLAVPLGHDGAPGPPGGTGGCPLSQATFRFYSELNDFLPIELRGVEVRYTFAQRPTIKDAIEGLGIPHVEVEVILIHGRSVDFTAHLRDGDRVSVYPMFESLDVGEVLRLRPSPLRNPRFLADAHLRKLARLLRLLGFDTLYDNRSNDRRLVEIAEAESRIILTRDRQLLKHGGVSRGYWVRSVDSMLQAREILRRFDLRERVAPFRRCTTCNGVIRPVDKADVLERIPPKTAAWLDEYFACSSCGKLYWHGTHAERLKQRVAQILASEDG